MGKHHIVKNGLPRHRKKQTALYWWYHTSKMTDIYQAFTWKYFMSWGSDVQKLRSGKCQSYTTTMIRVSPMYYLVIRLWKFNDQELNEQLDQDYCV